MFEKTESDTTIHAKHKIVNSIKKRQDCNESFQTFGFVSEPSRKKKRAPRTTSPLSIQHPESKKKTKYYFLAQYTRKPRLVFSYISYRLKKTGKKKNQKKKVTEGCLAKILLSLSGTVIEIQSRTRSLDNN
jgi:hypothetical protein